MPFPLRLHANKSLLGVGMNIEVGISLIPPTGPVDDLQDVFAFFEILEVDSLEKGVEGHSYMLDQLVIFVQLKVVIGLQFLASSGAHSGDFGIVVKADEDFLVHRVIELEKGRTILSGFILLVCDVGGVEALIIVGDSHLWEDLLEMLGREEEETIIGDNRANLLSQLRSPSTV